MDIKAGNIEHYITQDSLDNQSIYVICGTDYGLVQEYFFMLDKRLKLKINDDLSISDLDYETIVETPSLLAEEAATISLLGGQRYIRIRNAKKDIITALKICDDIPQCDAIILIACEDIKNTHSLYNYAIRNDKIAFMRCFADSAMQSEKIISDYEKQHDFTLDNEAKEFLIENFGVDRMITRAECEKISIFADKGDHITLDDIRPILSINDRGNYDDLIYGLSASHPQELDKELESIMSRGHMNPVAILRTVLNHMMKILSVLIKIDQGQNPIQARKMLKPSIFFKYEKKFDQQIRILNIDLTHHIITILLESEKICKTSMMPADLICKRTLHNIGAFMRRHHHKIS